MGRIERKPPVPASFWVMGSLWPASTALGPHWAALGCNLIVAFGCLASGLKLLEFLGSTLHPLIISFFR